MPFSINKLIIFLIFCLPSNLLIGQLSSIYIDADNYYKQGMEFYDASNFGLAKNSFSTAEKKLGRQFDERSELLRIQSIFMIAKSSLLGGYPDGEKLILEFFKKYRPDPLAYQAIKEIANLKYDKKLYSEAIAFYELIDEYNLSDSDKI